MTQPTLFTGDQYGGYKPTAEVVQPKPTMKEFDGDRINPSLDNPRLRGQLLRVFEVLKRGGWWTYREIADITGDPETSISAQIRNLRKEKCGGFKVPGRHRGEPKNGLWEFHLELPNTQRG